MATKSVSKKKPSAVANARPKAATTRRPAARKSTARSRVTARNSAVKTVAKKVVRKVVAKKVVRKPVAKKAVRKVVAKKSVRKNPVHSQLAKLRKGIKKVNVCSSSVKKPVRARRSVRRAA